MAEPADARIRLGVGISPNLGAVSMSSTVLVTLTNQNSSSTQIWSPATALPSARFGRWLDYLPAGPLRSYQLERACAEFLRDQSGAGPSEIVIAYQAPAAAFPPNEWIAFKVPLQAPSTVP